MSVPSVRPSKWVLREMYTKAGMTDKEIGKRFGVTESTVGYWRRRLGIPTRKRNERLLGKTKLPHVEYEKVRFLYEKIGLSDKEIGKLLGLERTTIRQRRLRAGIETRPRDVGTRMAFQRIPMNERRKHYNKRAPNGRFLPRGFHQDEEGTSDPDRRRSQDHRERATSGST